MARTRVIVDFLAERGRTYRYGPDRSQRAELHLPRGPGPHPVIVLIHGGGWRARFSKIVMRALARDLRRRGFAVWNIEYRRVGNGGGWPNTFQDVADAIDHLATIADPALDLERVTLIGHSAGGHLALWAASRENLPPGAPGQLPDGRPVVELRQVVAQAGACDLAGAYARGLAEGAAAALMGGSPEQFPERYDAADPIRLLALSIPALLVHGTLDETVSIELARNYQRAAVAAGCEVELVEIPGEAGSHRIHIDPRSTAWAAVTSRLPDARAHSQPATPLDRVSGPYKN